MNKFKLIVVSALTVAVSVFMTVVAGAQVGVQPSDTAAYYTSKCVMCHGKKAEKKFDVALTDDQMVEAVLKGKKAAKPPHMPAYGEKGVNAEQAKALVDHMKALKAAP